MSGQKILLGVTAGIAAYKSAELIRRLREHGAEVRVVMTANAQHFIGAATLQALSGNPVRNSLWDEAAEAAMGHIELARWANTIVIAPASANALAGLAHGFANDLLSTLCLATDAPIICAPAMNRLMWANAATQANVATLAARGYRFLGPATGDQACGEVGAGRMVEPADIVEYLLSQNSAITKRLAAKKILVSAGPTFEDIDPVRFIGNRSSGKMGFALAQAAAEMGAEVVLIAGPVHLPTPQGVKRVDVRSAQQMHQAVLQHLSQQDVYIGAAAIADYRPAQAAEQKIKKTEADTGLALVRTTDVLAEVAQHQHRPTCVVGFAAETQLLEQYALGKLQQKHLDFIAANDVSATGQGFESDENALMVFSADARVTITRKPKLLVAYELLTLIAQFLELKSRGSVS